MGPGATGEGRAPADVTGYARSVLRWAVAGALCCPTFAGCKADAPGDPGNEAMEPDDDGGDSSTGDPSPGMGDVCEVAPRVEEGPYQATLRGLSSTLGGVCGNGGPEGFVRLMVPRRADVRLEAHGAAYSPIVGVLPGCVGDWDDRSLLCTQGLPGWILDVAAGTELFVAVGIEPDHPAIATIPEDGSDLLAFVLHVGLREVLTEGEMCAFEGLGRCESGTACIEDEAGVARCTALEGDTCASAEELSLSLGTTMQVIDPQAPHTDAHIHACGGARRIDQVFRLRAADALEPGGSVEISTTAPEIGLAVRGPGCLPGEEIACAPGDIDGAHVIVDDLSKTLEVGGSLFVFVEMPPGSGASEPLQPAPGEQAPFALRVELLPPQ